MYSKKSLSIHIFFAIAVLLIVSLACSSNTALQTQTASTGEQGQSEPTIHSQVTYTQLPTYTLYPTNTPYPKPTEIPTATKIVVTNTPKPTENPELIKDKEAGVWLVGSEVAVGLWRASGDCYAVTNDKNGNQLDMVDGAHSIISAPAEAFTVEFVSFPGSCTWSYLDTTAIPAGIESEVTKDKGAGIWLVGYEVAIGNWRASGDCYSVTYDKDINQLDMASGNRSIISVPANAFTVQFVSFPDSCTWSYLGK